MSEEPDDGATTSRSGHRRQEAATRPTGAAGHGEPGSPHHDDGEPGSPPDTDDGEPNLAPRDLSGLPWTTRVLRQIARSLLPRSQRRTLAQMHHELNLSAGDRKAKTTAFWSMLTLSAIIASAGVLADSTATVIGAMIIAPLSTPIMGIALGLATSSSGTSMRSFSFVLRGAVLVVGIGAVFSFFLPATFALADNSQISGRTSPGLPDLIAAIATGFAGAIALSRKDVASVMPGVAISISLVPPLAVVGVCLGDQAWTAAAGALTLFLSNALALVLAGTIVFAAMKLVTRPPDQRGERVFRAVMVAFFVVGLPLVANSVAAYYLSSLQDSAYRITTEWLGDDDAYLVQNVTLNGTELNIELLASAQPPDTAQLLTNLSEELPSGLDVVLETTLGQEQSIGTTGDSS